MRANEIYQKSRKEKETFYKRYKDFDDLFAEIIQSEIKFFGSIKKIPFDTIVETSKIAYEYVCIVEGGQFNFYVKITKSCSRFRSY